MNFFGNQTITGAMSRITPPVEYDKPENRKLALSVLEMGAASDGFEYPQVSREIHKHFF
ncbi:unnamed protein product [Protopolystoma xenopodis]|uniref:Uncharacterized protein n=1 Tax=Protopolystoma xenopodis TaxID=117903 RepID=A0A448WZ12_9PLAT|nr:unnamed protein product [Protopolystoma xenopodis]